MIYFNTDATNLKELMSHFLFPYSKTTFYDKDCTDRQCYSGRRRSFTDLYEIATTYFPETTEKELIELLPTLEANGKVIFGHYCRDVGGAVFSARSPYELDKRYKMPALSGANYYTGQEVSPVHDHLPQHKSIYQLRKLLKS